MGFREIASLMELVSSKLQVVAMTSPCKPPCMGGQRVLVKLGQFGNEELTAKVDNNRSSLSPLKHGQSKAALSCVATPPAEFLFQQRQQQRFLNNNVSSAAGKALAACFRPRRV